MSEIGSGETIRARRQRLSGIPRACEACSVRKVRCDRNTPCSNCVAYGIACQGPILNMRPKSDRVSQLEERIEALESRLCAVEDQLPSQNTPIEPVTAGHERTAILAEGPATLYEGDSAFSKQLLEASHATQKTVPGASGLESSFVHLQALTESPSTFEDHRFSQNHASQAASLVMPLPFAVVAGILRRIKECTPIFCYGYLVTDISTIERLCYKAYTRTASLPPGHATSVLGILYFIVKELVATSDPLCQEHDLRTHLASCEQSFKASIETYELLAVPSFESVLALALGALKAQEDAKPFLLCTLISAAANHCRTLGYHRQKTYENARDGNAENARRAFWSIYVSDKTASLLLGRASHLQDSEIDAQYPAVSADEARNPWDKNFVMAIQMAQLQGQIYDRLYSPVALKEPPGRREETTNELARAVTSWRHQHTQIDASKAAYFGVWVISRQHWDVIYYSTLTSLLRATTASGAGSKITSQCFHAARRSLQSHMSCFSAWEKSGVLSAKDYANWVLHYSSFTSFVVIFLHAISAANNADLQLLENVVRTLDSVRESSKYSERLYQICTILAKLAKKLMGSQNASAGVYHPQEDTLQFEKYVNLSPVFEPQALQDSLGMEMTDYLRDWEAYDMDTVLANWANGESIMLNMY